jgi:hypothetical protein
LVSSSEKYDLNIAGFSREIMCIWVSSQNEKKGFSETPKYAKCGENNERVFFLQFYSKNRFFPKNGLGHSS